MSVGPASGISFHKVSGGGNDFILVDARQESPAGPADGLARSLCRRGLSVGADGLILVRPAAGADLAMEYYNADGSRTFCGNGSLCVARWAHEVAGLPARMTLRTDKGDLEMQVRGSRVVMQMPPPAAWRHDIDLEPAGFAGSGILVDTGCPHLVVICKDFPEDDRFEAVARRLRHHPGLGPAGANVDFVTTEDPHRLRLRTFERGVEAETLASGTGCLAAALAAASLSLAASPVTCLPRGGDPLKVRFNRTGKEYTGVSLEGGARLICAGAVGPDALS